jgi:hypothetical protein
MDKLKVIMQEPTGSRRTFFYDVKDEKDTEEVLEMIRESIKPGFSMESYQVVRKK